MSRKIARTCILMVLLCLSAMLGYLNGANSTDAHDAKNELTYRRAVLTRERSPDQHELFYPNLGLSLIAPKSWTTQDGPARLAGGEFNLVSRYEDDNRVVGMNFRLIPVPPAYIADWTAELKHERDFLEHAYPGASVEAVSIADLPATLFTYDVPDTKRIVHMRLYSTRLVPEVELQIRCGEYMGIPEAGEFWKSVDGIMESIVVASDNWQAKFARSETR